MVEVKLSVDKVLIEEAARRAERRRDNTKTRAELTRSVETAARNGTPHMFGLVKAALA